MSRAWEAARHDRLTADWLSSGDDINQELRSQLHRIRNRAREQEQNGEHARRFLQLVQTHVVGPQGFTLQVTGTLRSGDPDRRNLIVESAFWRWCQRGVCDVTGRLSFTDLQRLFIRTVARDGEALVRFHDVAPSSENPFGFQVEILDPARLDHEYFEDLPGGARVRLGVELNSANRALAYYLRRSKDNEPWKREYERVPASQLVHSYIADRPEQWRGVSWMAAALMRVHSLGAYEDAAITAARVGASKMGFFESPDGRGHALADGEENGELLTDADPGHFGVLPRGYKFQSWDPNYPTENFDSFVKQCLHTVAAGWGTSYHALTGDLTAVNFSSIRSGTLEEREAWMVIQNWMAAALLTPVFLRWLSAAVFNDALGVTMSQDEALSRFSIHSWQGRRWPWVDPLKDIDAATRAIAAGLKSPQQVAAEMGVDVEEILDQIARFQALAKEKGVTIQWGATPPPPQKESPPPAADE